MTTDTSTPSSAADRDQLAVLHVPLVAHLVRETLARVPSSVDHHDLLSAGLLALLASARDVDPARTASFAEHASVRIRRALVDELRSVDWAVRAACPRDPAAARARLDAVLAHFPDAAEVAVSLDHTAGPVASPRPAGEVDPRDWTERVQCVALGLEELPQRLRQVARGYFLEQRSLADLAAEVGASEARAAELLAEALVLLRDALATAMGPEPVGTADAAEVRDDDGAHDYDHDRRRLAYTRAVAVQYAARRSLVAVSRQRYEASA